MEISKERKEKLRAHFGTLSGKFRRAFLGNDESLGFLLATNELLQIYTNYNETYINNFLRGYKSQTTSIYNPDTIQFQTPAVQQQFVDIETQHFEAIRHGNIVKNYVDYPPITKAFINALIELDEVFRLSKRWNTQPIVLYRGTVPVREIDMNMFNSWSMDERVAEPFIMGSVLKTELPAGFPYIVVNEARTTFFENEQELLLPPCEFETLSVKQKNDVALAVVRVRPISLAKLMLERMKNPPKDYPRKYVEAPIYEFQESLKILEDYIENYVNKGLVRVGSRVVEELPDPEIKFMFEEESKDKDGLE